MTMMLGAGRRTRIARTRTYLMCPPDYFDVTYAINPWMDPSRPVDTAAAMDQWQRLRDTYTGLGHTVHTITPEPGLPDMVFAANGGTVIGGQVLGARFRYRERQPEAVSYLSWFRLNGYPAAQASEQVNEGEGDIVFAGTAILAGYGFRSDPAVATELAGRFGLPVISLRLTDPRFYHLDTALAVLSGDDIMYYPEAFSPGSRAVLAHLFPTALTATAEDAAALGLNAVSDGRHVLLPAGAGGLFRPLRDRGYEPIGVDMSELHKAGGSVKCCTLELRD
jgi:N-dimethylarginine dimethylaminohydrolase